MRIAEIRDDAAESPHHLPRYLWHHARSLAALHRPPSAREPRSVTAAASAAASNDPRNTEARASECLPHHLSPPSSSPGFLLIALYRILQSTNSAPLSPWLTATSSTPPSKASSTSSRTPASSTTAPLPTRHPARDPHRGRVRPRRAPQVGQVQGHRPRPRGHDPLG